MRRDAPSDTDFGRLAPPRERVRLLLGTVVPGTRYRITGWLGDGATGVVYEAAHTELQRTVAIKVLHAELIQDPGQLETFRSEARTTSRIGSPNIVEIFDFVELPDGRLAYVMERLIGDTLQVEVARAPMDPGRLVGILRQACRGLSAAHEVGVVHRDVKPDNMVVLAAERGGRVDRLKLMDFGIAAFLGQRDAPVGTPAYMAPETIRGRAADATVDVYALGCTAYELVAGRPPFTGLTIKAVLRGHLREPPVPLASIAPGATVAPLAAVIERCLAKESAQRYPTMVELEAALCEAQIEAGLRTPWDDLPIPAVEEARRRKIAAAMPSPAAHGRARRSWLLPAIGGAAAASIAFVAWALAGQPKSPEVDALVEQARDAAAKARYVYPPGSDPEAPTAYAAVLQLEALDESVADDAARELRREFADTLADLGDHYWDKDNGRPFALDYYALAQVFVEDHARAIDRARLTPGQLASLQDRATTGFSDGERHAGDVLAVMAIEAPEQRDEALQRIVAEPGGSLTANVAVADWLDSQGHPVAAPLVARAPARSQRPAAPAAEDDDEDEVVIEADDGTVAEPDDAAAAGDAASAAGKPAGTDRQAAREVAAQGHAALRGGQWSRAEQLFHKALGLDRRCAEALIGLSEVYFERSEYQRAIAFAEKAVDVAGKNSQYRLQLGDAYYKVLRYADARREYEKALQLGNETGSKRIDKLNAKVGG